MKENTSPRRDDKNEQAIIWLAAGITLIGVFSVYFPPAIVLMLFLAPFALKEDMLSSKPVFSIIMFAASAGVLAVNIVLKDLSSPIYAVYAVSTGASAMICYIVWKYIGIDKFEDGFLYAIVISIVFATIASAAAYVAFGREPFSIKIVSMVKEWLISTNSSLINTNINAIYSAEYYLKNSDTVNMIAYMQTVSESISNGIEVSKAEQIAFIMPNIERMVNRISMHILITYPAFAAVITWWRGNYRYSKASTAEAVDKNMKPKPFSTFRIPAKLTGVVIIGVVLSFLLQISESSDLIAGAGLILQDILFVIFSFQGFAVMEYFFKRVEILRFSFFRIVIMVFIAIITIGVVPVMMGTADLFINFRLVYAKSREMKEKLKNHVKKNGTENKR
ncbi:MAG: DUF2232 domain-containing protein [Clostridia bacterium]|nr:DUF2232 domain-containing protein [Clostridia bacterium]